MVKVLVAVVHLAWRSWQTEISWRSTSTFGIVVDICTPIAIWLFTFACVRKGWLGMAALKAEVPSVRRAAIIGFLALLGIAFALFLVAIPVTIYEDHEELTIERDAAVKKAESLQQELNSPKLQEHTLSEQSTDIKDKLSSFEDEYQNSIGTCYYRHRDQETHDRNPSISGPQPPVTAKEWADCQERKAIFDIKVEKYVASHLDDYYLSEFKNDAGFGGEAGTLRQWIDSASLSPKR